MATNFGNDFGMQTRRTLRMLHAEGQSNIAIRNTNSWILGEASAMEHGVSKDHPLAEHIVSSLQSAQTLTADVEKQTSAIYAAPPAVSEKMVDLVSTKSPAPHVTGAKLIL